MFNRHICICVFLAFVCCSGVTAGQSSRGSVSGTISDTSGAVIGGASAVLTHSDTDISRTAISNEAGIYRFDAVELGIHEIKVTREGFSGFVSRLVRVDANRTTTVNASLEVGPVAANVEVTATTELLVKDSPLRGGNFLARDARDLPLISLNPISLARTLPGVIQPTGSWLWQREGEATEFSVNGQRIRGNNYLLDGTDNNDIAFGGPAQTFHIADAVEEVSVQTGNFGVEFGRAGGGVFNVVTKSGTNTIRGSVSWRYQSQRFNSVSNENKRNNEFEAPFSRNVYGFTLGGPIRRNRTFFFTGFQQDTRHSDVFRLMVPTAGAVDHLRSLFPAGSNPRLDLYLKYLGDLRGTGDPIPQNLGIDPVNTTQSRIHPIRQSDLSEFPRSTRTPNGSFEWITRSPKNTRFPDATCMSPGSLRRASSRFQGSSRRTAQRTTICCLSTTICSDQATPTSFDCLMDGFRRRPTAGRHRFRRDLPRFIINNSATTQISGPGTRGLGQSRMANNFLFQETQTKLSGRHTLRYGVEFLWQVATQSPPAISIGQVQYGNHACVRFRNFLDDFSGASGRLRKQIGAEEFHPDQFRHSYFFQDTWKPMPSLNIVLGLRYENFGQPANTLAYPAFAGFDPDEFTRPNRVNLDNNNFGPAVGLAWSPSPESGWMARLFGDGKTVLRAGFQISYDAFFTQMIALGPSTSTPNASSLDRMSPARLQAGSRGIANWSEQLPTERWPSSISDAQDGMLEKDFSLSIHGAMVP